MKSICLTALVLGAASLLSAEVKLGKPLTLKEPMAISAMLDQSTALVNKPVQVKGRITEVCKMEGCWMQLVDPASQKTIRFKVNDGEIVFKPEHIGKMTIAEGTLSKIELTKERAVAYLKHEAEERGHKFDPAKVTSGMTIYQIKGSGAVVLD